MIDEAVHLVAYRADWADCFLTERTRIVGELGIDASSVEHIGSTAVVGLSAKPIVDIMIGAETFPPPRSWSDVFVRLGYESMGEAGVPERLYFRSRAAFPTNVHVVLLGGLHWTRNLALRNYLRRSTDAATRYESAKRDALRRGAVSLLAYSEAKAPVIERLLAEAVAESEEHT
jgi:GrpB-like predicted nucleotidyltransferase (UPF0157 family)